MAGDSGREDDGWEPETHCTPGELRRPEDEKDEVEGKMEGRKRVNQPNCVLQ